MIPSIRLNDETAKIYGRRVLLPGTAEYAAFMAPHTEPKPEPEPETEEPTGPDVTHEVREDGSWSVTRDGEPFALGKGEESLKDAIEKANAGEEWAVIGPVRVSNAGHLVANSVTIGPAPTTTEADASKFDGISVPKLRVLASKHGISYAGLKRRALIQALLAGGV